MSDDSEFLKELQDSFLIEASDHLEQVESYFLQLERDPNDQKTLEALSRVAHNFKGSGKAVGFDELSHFSHAIEDLLVAVRSQKVAVNGAVINLLLRCCDHLRASVNLLKTDPKAPLNTAGFEEELKQAHAGKLADGSTAPTPREVPTFKPKAATPAARATADESVRVSLKKIDDLLNLFGEQVILQSALDHVKYDPAHHQDLMIKTISQLNRITHDLQQTMISLRMVSLRQLFSKMERTTRDTAAAVNKKIEFIPEGQDNELDKTIVEALADPLMHMIRNSVDHGVETPAERVASGKSEIGHVHLRGYRGGGFFYIEIEDDGKGMDPARIFEKAVAKNLVRADQRLTEAEILNLIFANGFSTKDSVSEISGRGVGMNVVQEMIEHLKGSCGIQSTLGQGTKFTIRLPLTLALFNGVIIRVGGDQYVLPNSDVEEFIEMPRAPGPAVNAAERVVQIRDEVFPVIDLGAELAPTAGRRERPAKTAVIVRRNGRGFALLVDEVVQQQRIVHKNVGPEARTFRAGAGATILGDGSVAIILEVGSLVDARAANA